MTDAEEFILSTYNEIEILSRSNISEVALVRNIHDQKLYIRRSMPSDHSMLYKALKSASISGIPSIEAVIYDGRTIVIEEYVNGTSLSDIITNHLTSKDLMFYASSLLRILAEIHKLGIVHCDLKEDNIIITNDHDLILIDFAISTIKGDIDNVPGRILGTAAYAAPEQFGLSEVDLRSDLYSFGIICRNMIKLCNGLTSTEEDFWERVVSKCTIFDPADRFQSAQEILQLIRQPDLIMNSDNSFLIHFPNMKIPPFIQVLHNEEKNVSNIWNHDKINIRSINGEITVTLANKSEIKKIKIFDSRLNIDSSALTEIYFMNNCIIAARAFCHFNSMPPFNHAGYSSQKKDSDHIITSLHQVRILYYDNTHNYILSDIMENLSGYSILGDAEYILDNDNLTGLPLPH